jgi:hypothetical protein
MSAKRLPSVGPLQVCHTTGIDPASKDAHPTKSYYPCGGVGFIKSLQLLRHPIRWARDRSPATRGPGAFDHASPDTRVMTARCDPQASNLMVMGDYLIGRGLPRNAGAERARSLLG